MRITAIVTQLVFEHALRIRVKAETSSSPRSTPAVTPETRSEATTPDNLSIVGDTTASETEGASGDENVPSTTPSSIKGKQKDSPATPAPGDDSEDLGMSMSSNLVGKMNNLVSTDLENLVDGRDFLLISLSFAHMSFRCLL